MICEDIVQLMEQDMPSFFKRADVEKYTNGLFKASTISSMNRAGKGPTPRLMGRTVCYMRSEFIAWLREYYGGMHGEFTFPGQ